MSRTFLLRGGPWLDVLLLVATLAPAAWMATRGEAEIERDLALSSTQWQRELDEHVLGDRSGAPRPVLAGDSGPRQARLGGRQR
jgi:hypothetical protein